MRCWRVVLVFAHYAGTYRDELVIETPGTLFTAEGYSDDDRGHHQRAATTITGNTIRKKHIPARFAIEDDDDNQVPNNTFPSPPMRDTHA